MKKRTLSCLLVLAMLLGLSAFASAETPTNAARSGVVRLVESFLSDGEVDSVNLSTAFFVGKEGDAVQYLVTNYHCVSEYLANGKGAAYEYRDAYAEKHSGQYRLNIFYDSEKTEEVYVVDSDEGQDIALLKLDHPTEERIALALQVPDNSMVGDTIYTVGFPGAADDYMTSTSSWGPEDAMVAKGTLGRLVTESATGTKWVQSSDMAASKGSSGSPILTEDGMVIGVVSQASEDHALYVNADISTVIAMLNRNHIAFDLAEDRMPQEEPTAEEPAEETTVETVSAAEATEVPGETEPASEEKTEEAPVEEAATETPEASETPAAEAAEESAEAETQAEAETTETPQEETAQEETPTEGEAPEEAAPEETADAETPAEEPAPSTGLPVWAYAAIAAAVIVIAALLIAQNGKKKKAAEAAAAAAAAAKAAEAAKKASPAPAPAPEKPLRPMVRSLADQHRNRKVQLGAEPVIAGRSPKCSIIYRDDTPGVSGTHCSVAWDAAKHTFIVKDLGSSYGTYLESGMRLEPNREYLLKPGESVYLGDKTNTLRMEVE
jgi:S1-C subfamily serine protease